MPHPPQWQQLDRLESRVARTQYKTSVSYSTNTGSHRILRYRDASHSAPKDSTGWRKPSPYAGYEFSYRPGWFDYRAGDWSATNQRIGPYLSSNQPQVDSFPQLWSDSAYQRALLKMKHRNLNLAVSLGEIRQTYRLLRDSVERVRSFVRWARKVYTLRRVWQIHRTSFAEFWLELRYGWRPLLSDLYGAADAIDARLNGEYDKTSLTCRARNQVPLGSTAFKSVLTRSGGLAADIYEDQGGIFTARVRLDALVLDAEYRRLVDFGVHDPLLLAWELCPYSFVADWFVGIGKFLDGLTAFLGLSYRGGSVTRHLIVTKEIRAFNVRGHKSWSYGQSEYSITKRFERSVVIAPVSKLVWYGFDRLSYDKKLWVDAMTLLRQALFYSKSPRVR